MERDEFEGQAHRKDADASTARRERGRLARCAHDPPPTMAAECLALALRDREHRRNSRSARHVVAYWAFVLAAGALALAALLAC